MLKIASSIQTIILLTFFNVTISSAQTVNIPDANFKAALVGNTAINTNNDNEIQTSEAQAFSGSIDVNYQTIADLTGIAAFTALTELHCSGNQLTTIDISTNTALTTFYCSSNQLTSIDISNNTALTIFDCSSNQITSINLSNNPALRELYVKNNVNLTNIDVSIHTSLRILHCYNNDLSNLDVSNNSQLRTLYCFGNKLTTLDVSTNHQLFSLHCNSNDLTSLNVSTSNNLGIVRCQWNELTNLDFSNNAGLSTLSCQGNQLTSLNLQNGTNAPFFNLEAGNNPNLSCIQVDDSTFSATNWTNIDPASSFSTNCNAFTSIHSIRPPTFSISPNPANQTIRLIGTENNNFETINCSVYDLNGREIMPIKSPISNINSLPAGIYFLRGTIDQQLVSAKLVIAR